MYGQLDQMKGKCFDEGRDRRSPLLFAQSAVLFSLVLVTGPTHEDKAPIAHLDLVAGVQLGGPAELGAVYIGAVFRSDVVQFALFAGVTQNGTMPAGNVWSLNDDIIIGKPADRIDANLEGVDGSLIHEPMIRRRRGLIRSVLNHCVRAVLVR